MQLPDDFGLSPVQTLARVGDPQPSHLHSAFWSHWQQAVAAVEPGIDPIEPASGGQLCRWLSVGAVRITGLLLKPRPPHSTRAAMIVLHGYESPAPLEAQASRWEGLVERGVAVLVIRVRGYPHSQLDTGDLTSSALSPFGYISHGLDAPVRTPADAMAWILPRAVADVATAARGLREHLARSAGQVPLYLAGESFGGGLAVIAASVLGPWGEVQRLVIGLPSLGDWTWRLEHRAGSGAGAHVAALLRQHASRQAEILATLRLCDAVVHAPRVRCPVLCKLALRDDVVPAPAAAAVFNALGSAAGNKWRCLVPFGHFDGGIRNARAHADFDRLAERFLDPATDPAMIDVPAGPGAEPRGATLA